MTGPKNSGAKKAAASTESSSEVPDSGRDASRNRPKPCTCLQCEPELYILNEFHPHDDDFMTNRSPDLELCWQEHEPEVLATWMNHRRLKAGNRLTSDQREAVREFQQWRAENGGSLDVPDTSSIDAKVLLVPFQHFNRFLFDGALGEPDLRWYPPRLLRSRDPDDVADCTTHWDACSPQARMRFASVRRLPRNARNGRSRFDDLMSDLLHEMAHAFIDHFTCNGRKCGEADCVNALTRNANVGITGHGRSWIRVAAVVEIMASWAFGLSVDIGRRESIRREIEAGGAHPSLHDLQSYFGDGVIKDSCCPSEAATESASRPPGPPQLPHC